MKSQREAVLKHLMEIGNITSIDAFKQYGITRLSAIIYDLRRTYNIATTLQCTKNRYGNMTHYAKYTMTEDSLKNEY